MSGLLNLNFVLQDWFFFPFKYAIMDLQNISKSWILAYLRVLQAQKQYSKFQNFGVSTGKVIETQKCTQAARRPLLFCQFLTYNTNFELSTFGRAISLCRRILSHHIHLSSGKVSSKSEVGHNPTFEILVHLTWNDSI